MMWKKFIAWLLYHANRNPSQDFYVVKEKILKRHGKPVRLEYQHIKKQCWTCNGSGIYPYRSFTKTCLNCGGTGIYREFWSQLRVYKINQYEFHIPCKGGIFFKKPDGIGNFINGYIRHKSEPYRLSQEAKLWLFMIFGRELFWRSYSGRFSFYPLSFFVWRKTENKFKKHKSKIRALDLRNFDNMDVPF